MSSHIREIASWRGESYVSPSQTAWVGCTPINPGPGAVLAPSHGVRYPRPLPGPRGVLGDLPQRQRPGLNLGEPDHGPALLLVGEAEVRSGGGADHRHPTSVASDVTRVD